VPITQLAQGHARCGPPRKVSERAAFKGSGALKLVAVKGPFTDSSTYKLAYLFLCCGCTQFGSLFHARMFAALQLDTVGPPDLAATFKTLQLLVRIYGAQELPTLLQLILTLQVRTLTQQCEPSLWPRF